MTRKKRRSLFSGLLDGTILCFGRLQLEAAFWYVKYCKLMTDKSLENILDVKANEWPLVERAGIRYIVENLNGICLQELLKKLD